MTEIPDWVTNYPYEMDKAALINLAQTSEGSLDKPREMNFSLYDFAAKADAAAAAEEVQQAGWHCQIAHQQDDPSRWEITAQKQNYRLDQAQYEADTAFFSQVAFAHHGQYDGWFAGS